MIPVAVTYATRSRLGDRRDDAFDHFEERRENNVDYLRELPVSAGDRRAIHKEYGEITLARYRYTITPPGSEGRSTRVLIFSRS